jgi:predicted Zn-dependent peptidase
LESIGASYTVSASREHLAYISEVSSEKLDDLLPILADVLHPQVEEYLVKEGLDLVREGALEALSDPQVHVLEQLHADAFRDKGLGQPLYPVHNLDHLGVSDLKKFAAGGNHGDRVVVVAVGEVNHSKLSEKLSQHLSGLSSGGSRAKSPSQYVGGDSRVWAHGSLAHVALGFQGASYSDKDLPAVGVLQFLLGGGRVASKGGPGSGCTSRLNRNVVEPANGEVHHLSAFHLPYSDAGLFGFYGVAAAGKTASMLDRLTKEISALHSGTIDAAELARAKAQLKADALFGTQGTSSLAEYVGTRAIAGGKVVTPSEFAKAVEGVTAEDVKNAAKRVLKSKPTLSSVGNIGEVPSREQIQSGLA